MKSEQITRLPGEEVEIGAAELARAQAKFTEVYQQRCTEAWQTFMTSYKTASAALLEGFAQPKNPAEIMQNATTYALDNMQRSVLFWDTLRQRGNNWLAHEKAGKPPLLDYEWEMVADARTFEKPVNYALVRIIAPEGIKTDPESRPFVIIDPRAGHGPGIGGFKQDSQVGVALKAGHPVYFVIFFPEPMPGQTLADVSRVEAEFLRIVGTLHPKTRKPVVVGNCQGGWAAMLLGALEPTLMGPIVINGAPMSYWAGNDGENPMRYAGGMLGGTWPALLASDLGGGVFDGAYLVENFDYLNPGNTNFTKFYNLYSKIDTEPERFLEFEQWRGGFFLLNRQEIKWIVDNLFVGNKLSAGEAEWSDKRAFDLHAVQSPIIVFASLGDNITPPQQAFNWVADLYPTTEALKANGQVIIGMMHESVGHLGIFVSGKVAVREHAQIVDLIEYVETLPPGLYGMQIEEKRKNGTVTYDVLLTERRVEDLQKLQTYSRKDEIPFEAVETVSNTLTSAYETFVSPVLAPMVNPEVARINRAMNPQRMQRWAISDLNPMFWSLGHTADLVKANRVKRDSKDAAGQMEHWAATMIEASWDLFRDLRDSTVENAFFRTYSTASLGSVVVPVAAETADFSKATPAVVDALARMEEGDRTAALVRLALLLIKAGTGQRKLSGMKRVRDLIGDEAGLQDMPIEAVRKLIRQQSWIVDFEPERALSTLPKLFANQADRRFALDLLDHLEGKIELTPEQMEVLDTVHHDLGQGVASGRHAGKAQVGKADKSHIKVVANGTPGGHADKAGRAH